VLSLNEYKNLQQGLSAGELDGWTEWKSRRKELPQEDPSVWSLVNNIWRAQRMLEQANSDLRELLDRRISKLEDMEEEQC
jgi:hypothetical protein